jgi:hypothetical protein
MTMCTNESHDRDEFDGNCITCADADHYATVTDIVSHRRADRNHVDPWDES